MMHQLDNWALGFAGSVPFLWFRHAPAEADNYGPAPTVTWQVITAAASAVDGEIDSALPQILTTNRRQPHDLEKQEVLGVVWEICSRHENEEFVGSSAVCELVAAMHQHLGKHYEEFIKE